jgi:hypothetical protein
MRFSWIYAALGLVLISGPALAGNSVAAAHTCKTKVPCDDFGKGLPPQQWATLGNACVTEAFGYTNPNGFIDEVGGVDAQGNLASKRDSIPKGAGVQLQPQCSVLKIQENHCVIHCNLQRQL